ncbi:MULTISPECIES: competence/damage-inducible protein A [unclassified Gordonia (in: high G+C Gram-positive bacteria)]|uniref:competence/damage-inducible protein A n=1 Tax=unclassified Gordonia (in: high G+C Gram-positive bacteria) TaxID=2657482 RepID=UPI0009AE4B6B|nr:MULTISPECIES: competence/damage-inducible protein A [unclassified Gordonia (in: high G+C Gram-positive bacteria)]MDF3281279.1 competence/damage-inducible protein A [Gordonia sp. N1V]OPX10400.1 competence/damage-inducible protein A [Gordonia sp. i37]
MLDCVNVRAGIVVTGTEVLTGRISDANGPWVARRLLDLGVDVAHITICGDRPDDLTAQLHFLAASGVDLIVTTGGLGPTADDLTVETVARFCGRPLHLDTEMETHIAQIISRWQQQRGEPATESSQAGTRKQAMIPQGAQPIPPVGTAPGVAIPAVAEDARRAPAILVLPGPPRELQGMWDAAIDTEPIAAAIAGRGDFREQTIRAFGLSESDLAATLRTIEPGIDGADELEITTCLRRGEVEIVTRYPIGAQPAYDALAEGLLEHHRTQIFSVDGSTIDDLVAAALQGRSVATAESCTGGMIAARLTDRAGSSDYVMGGVVSYSNEAKAGMLDVPAELITEHGAVSEPVAAAMAQGAVGRFAVDIAVSTSGIAGPGGGTPDKPVGTVCFGVALAGTAPRARTLHLPGDRAAVRERSVTIAMHMLYRALRSDGRADSLS